MKTPPQRLMWLAATLGAAGLAQAIEAPADQAPPPAQDAARDADPAPDARAERPAYLGIATQPIPEMLAAHLDIEDLSGVIIRSVMPGSPAELAGLAEHDIITRLDGEPVASPEQLTERMLACRPDQEIRLSLIQRGKPVELDAILGERPDMPEEMLGFRGGLGMFDDFEMPLLGMIPEGQAEMLRGAIEQGLRQNQEAFGNLRRQIEEMAEPGGGIGEMFGQLQQRLERELGGDVEANFEQRVVARFIEPDGTSVEIESEHDAKVVTVRDANGEIIWNGPWDTPQDKDVAPPDIRERIERSGLDRNFGGPGLRFEMPRNFRFRQDPEAEGR